MTKRMKRLAMLAAVVLVGMSTIGARTMLAQKASITASNPPAIALLNSQTNTSNFFGAVYGARCSDGSHLGPDEYNRYWMGWDDFLTKEGIAHTVITDGEVRLQRLLDFQILILSNNYWLDDAQTKAVADWVRIGGKLIATLGTGYQGIDGGFLKGGTNALHQLWGDPSSKVYSVPWPEVKVTKNFAGPTKDFAAGTSLGAMADANFMRERPDNHKDVYAVLLANGSQPPAAIYSKYSKGAAVYLSVAPEFTYALGYDLAGHCDGDGNYGSQWVGGNAFAGYANPTFGPAGPFKLMKSVISFVMGL